MFAELLGTKREAERQLAFIRVLSRDKHYSECMTIPYLVGMVTGPILQTGNWRPGNQLYG